RCAAPELNAGGLAHGPIIGEAAEQLRAVAVAMLGLAARNCSRSENVVAIAKISGLLECELEPRPLGAAAVSRRGDIDGARALEKGQVRRRDRIAVGEDRLDQTGIDAKERIRAGDILEIVGNPREVHGRVGEAEAVTAEIHSVFVGEIPEGTALES